MENVEGVVKAFGAQECTVTQLVDWTSGLLPTTEKPMKLKEKGRRIWRENARNGSRAVSKDNLEQLPGRKLVARYLARKMGNDEAGVIKGGEKEMRKDST